MSKDLQTAWEALQREKSATEERLSVLSRSIADLERTMAVLNPGSAPAVQERGEFTGMTLREAATVLLKRAAEPMPTRQICDLLLAGGFKTTAQDFYMVVYAGLKGMPNFARTQGGAWVYLEGAEAGGYVEDFKKGKAKGAPAKRA